MTKFEKWCQENPLIAQRAGAATYLKRQKAKGEAFNAMLDLLAKIRFCEWPTIGLGIGLTAEEMDAVIFEAERLNYDSPKSTVPKRVNQEDKT